MDLGRPNDACRCQSTSTIDLGWRLHGDPAPPPRSCARTGTGRDAPLAPWVQVKLGAVKQTEMAVAGNLEAKLKRGEDESTRVTAGASFMRYRKDTTINFSVQGQGNMTKGTSGFAKATLNNKSSGSVSGSPLCDGILLFHGRVAGMAPCYVEVEWRSSLAPSFHMGNLHARNGDMYGRYSRGPARQSPSWPSAADDARGIDGQGGGRVGHARARARRAVGAHPWGGGLLRPRLWRGPTETKAMEEAY